MATRRIGQILVDLGYLTEDQLWDVLEEQKQSPGEVLGQVAVRLELVTDEQVRSTFERMAAVVDEQNAGDTAYTPMAPALDGQAYQAALALVKQ